MGKQVETKVWGQENKREATDGQRKLAKKLNIPLGNYRVMRSLMVGTKLKFMTGAEVSAASGIDTSKVYWELNGRPESGCPSSVLERGWVKVDDEGIYSLTPAGVKAFNEGISDDAAADWRATAKKRREKFVAAKAKPASKKPAKKQPSAQK